MRQQQLNSPHRWRRIDMNSSHLQPSGCELFSQFRKSEFKGREDVMISQTVM